MINQKHNEDLQIESIQNNEEIAKIRQEILNALNFITSEDRTIFPFKTQGQKIQKLKIRGYFLAPIFTDLITACNLIQELRIQDTDISDADLQILQQCKNLKILRVSEAKISGAFLSYIYDLEIHQLRIKKSFNLKENLFFLYLQINGSLLKKIFIQGIEQQKYIHLCKKLEHIRLTNCDQINDETILQIAKNYRNLKSLVLNRGFYFSRKAYSDLFSRFLDQLQKIELNNLKNIDNQVVSLLAKNCPFLLILKLINLQSIGNQAIQQIIQYSRNLKVLHLIQLNINWRAFPISDKNQIYEIYKKLKWVKILRIGQSDEILHRINKHFPKIRLDNELISLGTQKRVNF